MDFFAKAHALWLERADLLEGDDRDVYLGRVAVNRTIEATWQRLGGVAGPCVDNGLRA